MLLLLAILQHRCGFSLRANFLENWRIIMPALAALVVYWPVFVHGRYLAGFISIILIAMYSSIRLPSDRTSKHALAAAVIVLAVMTLIGLYRPFRDNVQLAFQPQPNPQWEIAAALQHDFGLQNGDAVGCIGNCFFSYWARLGKLRIVTEIPNRQSAVFRASTAATQLAALHSMGRAGAKVIVSTSNFGNGWQQLGHTDYFLYDLRRQQNVDNVKSAVTVH